MNKDIKKIAIVRLSALGDIVNSAIVLQFIHKKYPLCEIDWIVEEVFSPLLVNHKYLTNVKTLNIKKLKKDKSIKLLREVLQDISSFGPYDIIIDMQGLIKSSIVSKLLGKNTYGFDKHSIREPLASLLYTKTINIPYEENVIKRNTTLVAGALSFEINEQMILEKEPIFEITKTFETPNDKKNIAFIVGASWESKIYPKELLVNICNDLKENCHIIWGNDVERVNAEWICAHSDFATIAPKLALNELVSFISSMDLLIGNDTGPTHMAWAQNIPSITLLGPTTSRMICETPQNIGIKSSSVVNILKIDKNDFSIKDIAYTDVLKKAKRLLYGI
ncbi:lipopolysaccharide heptosyltransferase I [Sulfurimonas sp.]|uniref:lipopolysaccharide heptosyltransferase I n=1 Tax=Sulfurimonas sp. TaxID=2022749 RepID=UPI0025DCAFCE|nr:lipopolysaccharide heptosyltransferase I [Sulfurimonas sp.]MBT5934964.1 lipopolysaccharide heptosyltransferase I [Sulfurimonas sp.]